MKFLFPFLFVLVLINSSVAQQLPYLPIPLGAGTCEVWHNSIYHFGGSNNWSGSTCYPRVYRFDGSEWSYYDSIPDYNMWGVTSVLVGDNVFLLGAWPYGPQLNRKYDLNARTWEYLAESPNTYHTWGITAEVLDSTIYLFNPDGENFAYDIASDSWSDRTYNTATGTRDLSSILYRNEIYIIGWDDSAFYKYTPSTDTWTQLANSLYQVGACAMGIINDLIYFVGGNIGGSTGAGYKSIIVYDITTDSWALDSLEISSKRHWMATAEYMGGLYVVGGIDSIANAVDIVEQIVPQGTAGIDDYAELPGKFLLMQNYPNPFNPSTIISWQTSAGSWQILRIYDILGREIETLVNEYRPAGTYKLNWNAGNLPSGVYFCQLISIPNGNRSEEYIMTRKMTLIK